MSAFQVVLLEGLFYTTEDGSSLWVEQDDGNHCSVFSALLPLVGQRVQFAVHHLPPRGIQVGEPGAGSCRFPNGQGCPVRHDLHPDRLLTFHVEGVLRADPWGMEKFDGTVGLIPFQGMNGHYGRVASATLLDVEKMRDSMMALDPGALTAAGLGAKDIEALLARLRRSVVV